jgi:hypothetical protein
MEDQQPVAPDSGRFMSCSECQAQMRDRYFSLNERPICLKCRPKYALRISRTEGPGATWRVGMQGLVVAVVGVIALVAASTVWPSARILLLIPIGYFIGKRMMTSLGGYSMRRYQYLAVTLTYLCFLIGFAVSAVSEERDSRARRTEIRAKMQGTMATQGDALREEMAALTAGQEGAIDPLSDNTAPSEEQAPPVEAKTGNDVTPGPGLALMLILFSPVLAMLQFGIMFSAIGLLVLCYAIYQAWKQTDPQGMALELIGPFRVGQGPIPAR